VVYDLRDEIQTLRLEAKNYLNMFDKENHNDTQVFQLRVLPSIDKKNENLIKNCKKNYS
jgi:hypothetical protein